MLQMWILRGAVEKKRPNKTNDAVTLYRSVVQFV